MSRTSPPRRPALRWDRLLSVGLALLGASALLAACGETPIGVQNSGALPIAGEYLDAFEVYHVIEERAWIWGDAEDPQVFDLVRWDRGERYALGRTRGEPPRYSRFDWRYDEDDVLAYCHTVEGAATAAAAAAVTAENCAPADWILLFALPD